MPRRRRKGSARGRLGAVMVVPAPPRTPQAASYYRTFEELAMEIERLAVPPGYEGDPYCMYRAETLIDAAYRGWMSAIGQNMDAQAPDVALAAARDEGYRHGMAEQASQIERVRADAYQRGYSQAQEGVRQACQLAYQEGYGIGAKEASSNSEVNAAQRKSIRGDALAEAMEHCRVIQESNPSMADGAKACKRMIKKAMER